MTRSGLVPSSKPFLSSHNSNLHPYLTIKDWKRTKWFQTLFTDATEKFINSFADLNVISTKSCCYQRKNSLFTISKFKEIFGLLAFFLIIQHCTQIILDLGATYYNKYSRIVNHPHPNIITSLLGHLANYTQSGQSCPGRSGVEWWPHRWCNRQFCWKNETETRDDNKFTHDHSHIQSLNAINWSSCYQLP